MSDFAIALRSVSKSYRLWGRGSQFATLKSALLKRDVKLAPESSVVAVKNVTFTVDRGEAFGIIGRNGSGKSTLLKLISGILKPTEGKLLVNGRIAALIELGAGFHPEITGRENIYVNGIMLGLSRREIDQRFDRIVEFSGIREFLDQPVKTYSSGMYVRLGFAVAVHVDPDILLIDEVLSVGDEEFSAKCIAKIQEMKYRGVTLVFVTHQLDQVRQLCDRAIWLDHGEVVSVGDPARVVDDYLQAVAAPRTGPMIGGPIEPPADSGTSDQPLDAAEETEEEKPKERDPLEEERWGSGEVLLRNVSMCDEEGRELVALGAGSAVTVTIDVEVRTPQHDFVFGIGIFHADGTCVYGTNTEIEGFAPEKLERNGRVQFVMPALDLVAGAYRIDAAVHTKNGRAFDYRRGALRFIVGSRLRDTGVYRPPHEWKFEGGITFKSVAIPSREIPAQIAEAIREAAAEPGHPGPPDSPPAPLPRRGRRGD